MKKIMLSILVTASLYAGNLCIDGSKKWEKYDNGNKVVNDLAYGFYVGYISGIVGSLNNILFCIPNDVEGEQVSAIIRKYIKNNPEKWNKGNWNLVVSPLQEAFPCKKKK